MNTSFERGNGWPLRKGISGHLVLQMLSHQLSRLNSSEGGRKSCTSSCVSLKRVYDVNALSRRQALLEEEVKKADTTLADTVMKLAFASKEADGILKKVKYFETKTMRNEVEIEELDKTLRETKRMGSDSEQKLDEMTRRLGVQEEECKRSIERAEASESKILQLEEELAAVGENMKQLEISAEKAQQREEKLKEQIHSLLAKLKVAEARYEYGEMNITKLNHRIDDIEDDIYREKLKIKKVSDELDETFDDMLTNY